MDNEIKEKEIKDPTKLDLPKPIEDIYKSGFGNTLTRPGPTASEGLVTAAPNILAARTQQFLDAIEIEEYMQLTHTTESFGAAFRKVTSLNFKDQLKKTAPPALVYWREGSGTSTTYKILPQYVIGDEVATPEFVVTQIHKFYCRRKYIEIETRSITALSFTYDIFIIKDKFAREYRQLTANA